MKTKYILLTAILLICSISIWGQTKKNTSANSIKAIAEKVQMLETNTQEQFSQLQNENKALKEQLQKMESEITLYREDVRTKESEINSNLSDWLTLLSVVIGSITTGFGVVAPLLLNYFNNKKQESKLNEIQKKMNSNQQIEDPAF
jgi:flagellar motility protein MotE (MotC chaperone)